MQVCKVLAGQGDWRHGAAVLIKHALAPVIDLIYPPRCPSCGMAIAAQDGLCVTCWAELDIPGAPACGACQRPFEVDSIQDGAICAECLAQPPIHDGIAAGTLYNDASRRLILAFKHGRKIALAPMLSRLMNARLPQLDGEWLIVPVPLHRMRLWHRGFNQSALLAREIAQADARTLLVDGLVRRKATPSLGGLGKRDRKRALAGAVTVNPRRRSMFTSSRVILVDDVMTSGATSDACVKALKQAGAERVIVACFARVLDKV